MAQPRSNPRHARTTPTDSSARGLRLVGQGSASTHRSTQPRKPTTVIDQPTDPRWVLAVRTSQALQGAILPPRHRTRLIRMAKTFGLTAFDANMIIAMVQDQARRGYRPDQCPSASADQLSHISHPQHRRLHQRGLRQTMAWKIAWWSAALLTAELLLIFMMV